MTCIRNIRTILAFLLPVAALFLADCTGGPSADAMRQQLLRAREMNKNFVPFTFGRDLPPGSATSPVEESPDSVMQEVTAYYDRHGSPNERMEAHYLLGCVYCDLGEAPRAIDCYLDAAACADTTATDCDFWMMASIYSQMAKLYHQQLLLEYEIEARRQSRRYNLLAGDTLSALYDQKMEAGIYILQNKRDSAVFILNDVIHLYREKGYEQEAIQASTMLMHIYMDIPERQSEMKQLIDCYDHKSELFDKHHELPPSVRQYFYYKAKYFENVEMLDSAEHYYRKVYRPGMTFVDYDPMYRGLLNVFSKQQNADSIAKYAQLFCAVNDSSIAIKDQEVTARMTASYNYSNYQKKSAESAKRANKLQSYVIVLLVIIIICIVLFVVLLHRHNLVKREKQKTTERMKAEIASLKREYEGKIAQLKQLEESHEKRINTIQKELGNAKEKNKESQEIILKLNNQFEEERNSLLLGVKEYADKVSELERLLKITEFKKNSVPYLKLGFIIRIKDYYVKDCEKKLTGEELNTLVEVTNDYFPDLISDLNGAPGISTLGMHVCLLVALNIQPNEITHLLGISSAQVGNLKKDVNNALFGESTAKTLYKNLTNHYKIMSA